MAISTQTLANASSLMERELMRDRVRLYELGPERSVGYRVVRDRTLIQADLPALVQTTDVASDAESFVSTFFSIKLPQSTPVVTGHLVEVTQCEREPHLIGKTLLVERVSFNGLALLRKAIARGYTTLDSQGKGAV